HRRDARACGTSRHARARERSRPDDRRRPPAASMASALFEPGARHLADAACKPATRLLRHAGRPVRTRTGNPHPPTRHRTTQGPPMNIPARHLPIGAPLSVNACQLHAIAVECDIGPAVLTAEFDFLLHFTRDDIVDVITSSDAAPVAA